MLFDRRKEKRHSLRRGAQIQCAPGALPRDCLVTDISDGGVRLHTEAVQVPDEFVLLLADGSGRRDCRVIWRLGFEIGAEFMDVAGGGFARRVASA